MGRRGWRAVPVLRFPDNQPLALASVIGRVYRYEFRSQEAKSKRAVNTPLAPLVATSDNRYSYERERMDRFLTLCPLIQNDRRLSLLLADSREQGQESLGRCHTLQSGVLRVSSSPFPLPPSAVRLPFTAS